MSTKIIKLMRFYFLGRILGSLRSGPLRAILEREQNKKEWTGLPPSAPFRFDQLFRRRLCPTSLVASGSSFPALAPPPRSRQELPDNSRFGRPRIPSTLAILDGNAAAITIVQIRHHGRSTPPLKHPFSYLNTTEP